MRVNFNTRKSSGDVGSNREHVASELSRDTQQTLHLFSSLSATPPTVFFFIVFPYKVHKWMIYSRGYFNNTRTHARTHTHMHTYISAVGFLPHLTLYELKWFWSDLWKGGKWENRGDERRAEKLGMRVCDGADREEGAGERTCSSGMFRGEFCDPTTDWGKKT